MAFSTRHQWLVQGDIDLSCIVTHQLQLDEAPLGYELFKNKVDERVKIVLKT